MDVHRVTGTPPASEATSERTEIVELLTPLVVHEIAGISALDAAIASEHAPGYVVLFQDSKSHKQANVEQIATLLRMAGAVPPESATIRQLVEKTRTRLAEGVGGTAAALRTLRVGARDMLKQYADALELAQGLTRIALEKAHGRTAIQMCTLTAHLAKLTGIERQAGQLPRPLREYFAGPDAKVCMRCHFDRPGLRRALERKDEHPYTYICAGCHDDAIAEFRPDLASQMERWTERAREARVIQHALGRPSKLMAAHTVMRRLSGLPEHPPQIAPAKPLGPPLPGPMPSPDARHGIVSTESSVPGEAEYIATLFAPGTVRNSW